MVAASTDRAGAVRIRLSDGTELGVDRIVLATGYKADLARVPYLTEVLPLVAVADGFPHLDDAFQTSLPGLCTRLRRRSYAPGRSSARLTRLNCAVGCGTCSDQAFGAILSSCGLGPHLCPYPRVGVRARLSGEPDVGHSRY